MRTCVQVILKGLLLNGEAVRQIAFGQTMTGIVGDTLKKAAEAIPTDIEELLLDNLPPLTPEQRIRYQPSKSNSDLARSKRQPKPEDGLADRRNQFDVTMCSRRMRLTIESPNLCP